MYAKFQCNLSKAEEVARNTNTFYNLDQPANNYAKNLTPSLKFHQRRPFLQGTAKCFKESTSKQTLNTASHQTIPVRCKQWPLPNRSKVMSKCV